MGRLSSSQGGFSRRGRSTRRGDHLGSTVLCWPTCKPGEANDRLRHHHQVQVRWEWGSLRLDAGRRKGRFNAKEVLRLFIVVWQLVRPSSKHLNLANFHCRLQNCDRQFAATQPEPPRILLIIIIMIDDNSENNHDNLVQPEGVPGSVDCYKASLQIDQATPEDSRQYRYWNWS